MWKNNNWDQEKTRHNKLNGSMIPGSYNDLIGAAGGFYIVNPVHSYLDGEWLDLVTPGNRNLPSIVMPDEEGSLPIRSQVFTSY